ncbi:MAG: hypothetical protein IK066_07730 [Kiritimatiellae bacterium]|nr:hypothetical protein [Kiritimatiellia bacterium]
MGAFFAELAESAAFGVVAFGVLAGVALFLKAESATWAAKGAKGGEGEEGAAGR